MSELRSGFTTGTCASAAAAAAAAVLCNRGEPDRITITLPDSSEVTLPIDSIERSGNAIIATVRKDSGDDPDITNGALIAVTAMRSDENCISIEAGEGVGTVTLPGLAIPPGEPAINPVPRAMIRRAVREVTDSPLRIIVSVPGGEKIAEKTYNPRLGIEGGISILGTTGRVRPFSKSALRCSMLCSLNVLEASGESAPVLVPGNIGSEAIKKNFSIPDIRIIEAVNDWGFLLKQTARRNFRGMVIAGHPGKLAKLIMGEWDTHSSRSASALPAVIEAGRNLDIVFSDSATVEGLFQQLSEQERRRLGDAIAANIRISVNNYTDCQLQTCVLLADLNHEILGIAGERGLLQT